MKSLKQILRYVIPYWGFASLNILFNILSVLFSIGSFAFVIPVLDILFNQSNLVQIAPEAITWENLFPIDKDLLQDNFNYFFSSIIIEYGEAKALLYIAIAILVFYFLKNFFRYFAMFFLAVVRNGVVKDLRNQLYLKILILPLAYFTQQRKGDIISRMTADVQEIEWSIMSSLEMIFREPITFIGFLFFLFFMSPQLTLFVLVLLPISGFIIGRIGKSLKRTSEKSQKKMGVILSHIEETISGLRIIKAFNAIDSINRKFKNINQEYTRLMIRLYRKRDLASPLSEFLGAIVLVLVLWYGGEIIRDPDSGLTGSYFIVYLAMFSQLIPPAKAVTSAVYNIQKGAASVERVQHILEADEQIFEVANAKSIKSFSECVEYKGVNFSYEKDLVLDNINLKIPKGKMVALVGPSGGGKSTLVDLLPRFYDTSEGEILIDGNNVKDYIISDVRGLMGIVTQESILFNDTVLSNIAFGMEDVSEADVIEAAKVANAHEFISKMENGYQSIIGDRGTKLSGGQRQRLSIARAVLKNPPILILDEATSSLDTESERLVQDALMKLLKNRTSIVIAHRLSTIQYADEILVIKKGELVERGNHSELIALNGVYKKLYDLQSFVN